MFLLTSKEYYSYTVLLVLYIDSGRTAKIEIINLIGVLLHC